MTHMCPATLATPLLTPGPGGATLLVTTCPIAPVAGEPGGRAGTSIHVVSRQRAGERLAIVDLRVDAEARCVTATPVGGDPWKVEHGTVARVKDDGNGKLSLTFNAGDMPTLARRPWGGWPLEWTEWLRQTHSGNPTVMFQAPPGQERDTAMAGSIYGALAAGGSRPVPVNLSLPGPVDHRLAPVPMQAEGRAGGKGFPKPDGAPAPPRKSSMRRAGRKPKPQLRLKASSTRPPTSSPKKDGKK